MSKIQKLHHFLNQNIIAKICLYALTLIQPILFYFSFAKNINVSSYSPYYFTWIGFYSCTVIIWAYHKKAWETILNIVIVVINLIPILFCCLGACMGGWLGLLWAMSTLTMPLAITMMFDGFIVKILECIGLVILLVVLALGIRAFLKSLDANMQQPGYVIGENIAPEREQNRAKIRAEIEQNIVPCAKTKEEFRCFLVDELGMKEEPITEFELTEAKAQFVLKLRRDLLGIQENQDNHTAQFLAARKVPLEQTGFNITKYAMEHYVDDYKLSDVTVFLEENSFTYYASGESYVRNDEEDRISRHLYDNIALFRGVTAEDIDTKSGWYDIYVTLLTGHALEEAR